MTGIIALLCVVGVIVDETGDHADHLHCLSEAYPVHQQCCLTLESMLEHAQNPNELVPTWPQCDSALRRIIEPGLAVITPWVDRRIQVKPLLGKG